MVHKSYANDPAKEKSRQLLKKTIEDTLLKFMRPQDIRVLHLPGPNGMEYKQVYGPLNIPPSNVIGLEEKTDLAEMARSNNPGTNVVNTTLEDFTKNPERFDAPSRYHVISMDFTQNASPDTLNELMGVTDIRANHFVYHAALQKRRENKRTQDFMRSLTAFLDLNASVSYVGASQQIKSAFDEGVEEIRETALTYSLLATAHGVKRDRVPSLIERLSGSRFRKIFQDSVKLYLEFESLENIFIGGKGMSLEEACDPRNLGHMRDLFINVMCVYARANIADLMFDNLRFSFPREKYDDLKRYAGRLANAINDAIAYSDNSTREIKLLSRYAYVSESGTPMVGDIAYMRTDIKLQQAYNEILNCIRLVPDFRVLDINSLVKAFKKLDKILAGYKFRKDVWMEREYLGSSARPILRREQAIELLRQGKTPNDLVREYRGMSRRRLGAFAAHLTMGTYDSAREMPEDEGIVQQDLRQDIETRVLLAGEGVQVNGGDALSKSDALEYLRAEISPKEIHQAYPGTSLPKIIAWEYWLNKGKYNLPEKR